MRKRYFCCLRGVRICKLSFSWLRETPVILYALNRTACCDCGNEDLEMKRAHYLHMHAGHIKPQASQQSHLYEARY